MPDVVELVLVGRWRPIQTMVMQAQIGDLEDYIKPKPDISPSMI